MYRKFFTVFLTILIASSMYAQTTVVKGKVDARMSEIVEPEDMHNDNVSPNPLGMTLNTEAVGTPVLAAKMWNVYGTIGTSTNAIDYDPIANTLAIVHRGDRANNTGSGFIWYVVSTDLGENFFDVGNFSFDGYTFGRYPNMMISNPTLTSDPFSTDLKPIMVWCGHGNTGNIWEAVTHATDQQFFGGIGQFQTVVCQDTCYATQGSVNQTNGNVAFLLEDRYTTDGGASFPTAALSYVSSADQGATWQMSDAFSTNELYRDGIPENGFVNSPFMDISYDGNHVLIGWQGGDGPAATTHIGVKRSSDGGATWSDVERLEPLDPNLGVIPFFSNGDSANITTWWDTDATHSSKGHHIITHINDNGGPGGSFITEFFWDYNQNSWEPRIVADVIISEWAIGNFNGRVRNESEIARSDDGQWLFAKWQDAPDTVNLSPDLFIAGRHVDGEWSEPINVTNTVDISEKYSNLAARVHIIEETSSSITAQLHMFYTILATDPTTGQPDADDTGEAEIWYMKDVTITLDVPVGIEDNTLSLPEEFELSQNYPNPFNPSTTISFTLEKAASVTLDIYSITGQKVATLVNGSRSAGTHDVVFDASNLTSGVYFYTLSSGAVSHTKKMVLLK